MTNFEILEQKIHDLGISLDIVSFDSSKIKGLYVDGSIALNKNLHTSAEKVCIASEELAHHELSVGNVLNMDVVQNRKQEYAARLLSYNKQIGLNGIIQGFEAHCCSRYELAGHLNVTEEFLQEALDCYKAKYGGFAEVDNYVIIFEPSLSVMEKM